MLMPDDVLILRGSPDGIAELRELAGAPEWRPPTVDDDPTITDLDRAVDVLVEMKNVSEVAVGLAYSALLFNDQSLAAEVGQLEDRLDEMRERLEVWVLRSAADEVDPSPLRGLLHLGAAAEEIGDAAQQMVWLVEEGEEMHPIVAVALGDADEVIARVPVAEGVAARRRSPSRTRSSRPRPASTSSRSGAPVGTSTGRVGNVRVVAGDELIGSGPDEGQPLLARALRVPHPRGRRHRRDRARARRVEQRQR